MLFRVIYALKIMSRACPDLVIESSVLLASHLYSYSIYMFL